MVLYPVFKALFLRVSNLKKNILCLKTGVYNSYKVPWLVDIKARSHFVESG